MYTTIERYASAVDTSVATASRRLKGIPFVIPTKGRGVQWYPLAAAVQTLRAKEQDSIPALVKHARDLYPGDFYVEPRALPIAESFIGWCEGSMRDRARAAQNSFVVAVSNSRICVPSIIRNLEPLKTLFVLNPEVTRWVLVGGTPPDVDNLAPAFAVSNNGPAIDEFNLCMQEAA